jgi:Tetratricopeptide repeat
MHILAITLKSQAKHVEAEELIRQTLQLKQTVLGPEDPVTLTSMSVLNLVLEDQGRYAEAEVLWWQSLKLDQSISGQQEPRIIANLKFSADKLRGSGDRERAEEIGKQIAAVREKLSAVKVTMTAGKGPSNAPTTLSDLTNTLSWLDSLWIFNARHTRNIPLLIILESSPFLSSNHAHLTHLPPYFSHELFRNIPAQPVVCS